MVSPLFYQISNFCLPELFSFNGVKLNEPCDAFDGFICLLLGLWSGVLISHICNYYTSKDFSSVKTIAWHSTQGISLNIISGLSNGLGSTALPIVILAITMFYAFIWCHFYGIALLATGFLSIMPILVTLSCFWSIVDTASGISSMCGLVDAIETTQILNTATK